MAPTVIATIVFLVELVMMFMFIYILFYLNPFHFEKESDNKLAYDLVTFELLSSSFIVLIFLGMLHTSAARSEISFLALTFLLVAAFACFVSISVCEWTVKNPFALVGTKLFSYQATQVVLFVLITLCVIRLTIRQDTEKKKKLRTFVPYHIASLVSVILLLIVPRLAFFLAVLTDSSSEETLNILKSLLFITPFYNLVFVVLINSHDPVTRGDIRKSVELSLRSIRTGPLPRINVQEPTSSSALQRVSHTPRRSHIALNLMRNPLNSFNKLQRQNTLNTEEREPHLLVIPKQQYYTTPSNERIEVGPIQEPEEILTSRSATEPGFKTVALLRRASMISMRLHGDLSSDSEPQTLSSSTESLSVIDQVSTATSPPRAPSPPIVTSSSLPEERHIDVFTIFVTSTSATPESSQHERKKRAVDRIREILSFG